MATTSKPDTAATRARSEAGRKAAATRKRNAARKAAATVGTDAKRTRTAAERSTDHVTSELKRTSTDAQTAADAVRDATEAEARLRGAQARSLAERSIDVPVGVGLVARDQLFSTVRGIADTLSDRTHLERELDRYERRGASARNRFESQVRRTSRDFSREVRERRTHVERLVGDAQRRISSAL